MINFNPAVEIFY